MWRDRVTFLYTLLLSCSICGCHGNICSDAGACSPWASTCTGCMLPSENPYVYIGQTLTLNCTLVGGGTRSSNDLYFTWKDDQNISRHFQRVVSPDVLQLRLPVTSPDFNEVNVLCMDGSRGAVVGTQMLAVEYAPREVTAVESVVDDWKNLTLSWDPGDYVTSKNVIISVTWTCLGCQSLYLCDNTVEFNTKCVISNQHYRDSSLYEFNITVTNIRTGDVNMTTVTIVRDDHVKPSVVSSVTALNVSSTCMSVQWRHTAIKPLVYRVRIDQTEWIGNVSTMEICNLHPSTMYTFSVSAKSVRGGYWSEPTTVEATTLEDKPLLGANVTKGSFLVQDCNSNTRNVFIYFKPPIKTSWNGDLTSVILTFTPGDGSRPITIESAISEVTQAAPGLKCATTYEVSLSTSNRMGSSPPSRLHIPRLGSAKPPSHVHAAKNGGQVKVTWDRPMTLPSEWTVFWCRGTMEFQTCKHDLDWKFVPGNENSTTLNVYNPDRFMFGVSMTTASVSSGIAWHDCLYDSRNVPNTKPRIQSLDARPHLGLTVRWAADHCPKQTLVTHYRLQYCHGNFTVCETAVIPSTSGVHIIRGLEEGVNYSVRIQQVAANGRGPYSDAMFATPVYNGLKTGEIVGITIGCLTFFVIVIGVFVMCIRFTRKKWTEKELIIIPGNLTTDVKVPQLPDRPERTDDFTGMTFVRQTSVDSGCDTRDEETHRPGSVSPSQSFRPGLQVLEEVQLSGQTSRGDNSASNPVLTASSSLALNYGKFAMPDARSAEQSVAEQSVAEQSVRGVSTGENVWENSGVDSGGVSRSVDNYGYESDSADDYLVTAVRRENGGDTEVHTSAKEVLEERGDKEVREERGDKEVHEETGDNPAFSGDDEGYGKTVTLESMPVDSGSHSCKDIIHPQSQTFSPKLSPNPLQDLTMSYPSKLDIDTNQNHLNPVDVEDSFDRDLLRELRTSRPREDEGLGTSGSSRSDSSGSLQLEVDLHSPVSTIWDGLSTKL